MYKGSFTLAFVAKSSLMGECRVSVNATVGVQSKATDFISAESLESVATQWLDKFYTFKIVHLTLLCNTGQCVDWRIDHVCLKQTVVFNMQDITICLSVLSARISIKVAQTVWIKWEQVIINFTFNITCNQYQILPPFCFDNRCSLLSLVFGS